MDDKEAFGVLKELEDQLRRKTIEKIMRETDWLTADEATTLPVLDWRREGRVFAVIQDGRELYPRYQFDRELQPAPIVEEVLRSFGVADCWTIAAWLHFPSGYITIDGPDGRQCVAPRHALGMPDAIRRALRFRTGTYVA